MSNKLTTADLTKALDAAKAICVSAGFEPDSHSGLLLTYTSREGGNGTDCEPDQNTLIIARGLVKEIRALGLEASRSVCDEWVSVNFGLPGSGAKDGQ